LFLFILTFSLQVHKARLRNWLGTKEPLPSVFVGIGGRESLVVMMMTLWNGESCPIHH